MDWLQAARRLRRAGLPLSIAAAAMTAGCVHMPPMNPFAAGGIDPRSPVAAEVVAASHLEGGYPRISQTPAVPTDVRSVPAWREAVVSEWRQKRKTETEAAALPFTLANTEEWAQQTRAKIPRSQATPPAQDSATQIEAFAAAARARATPPPPPQ